MLRNDINGLHLQINVHRAALTKYIEHVCLLHFVFLRIVVDLSSVIYDTILSENISSY